MLKRPTQHTRVPPLEYADEGAVAVLKSLETRQHVVSHHRCKGFCELLYGLVFDHSGVTDCLFEKGDCFSLPRLDCQRLFASYF